MSLIRFYGASNKVIINDVFLSLVIIGSGNDKSHVCTRPFREPMLSAQLVLIRPIGTHVSKILSNAMNHYIHVAISALIPFIEKTITKNMSTHQQHTWLTSLLHGWVVVTSWLPWSSCHPYKTSDQWWTKIIHVQITVWSSFQLGTRQHISRLCIDWDSLVYKL